jgi:predicted metal-dependent hydrolase
MNSVQFGNSQITYKVHKTKRRTTEIVVDTSGIEVLTSKQKSHNYIQNLVKKHSRWIFKKQLSVKEENKFNITFEHGSRLPFLGKNYLLDVSETKKLESFSLKNGKFKVKLNKISKPRIRKLYLEWSKKQALPLLEKSTKKYSKKIGVEYGKILIKNQKNRWGSVSKKGTINFNQNLIRAPSKIIDYVVAHEVCHLKIPNHSASYWRLLGTVMINYEERKKWLRINRNLLQS